MPTRSEKKMPRHTHQWVFRRYGRNKQGRQTVIETCSICGKRREMCESQQIATQKMLWSNRTRQNPVAEIVMRGEPATFEALQSGMVIDRWSVRAERRTVSGVGVARGDLEATRRH